MLLPFDSRRWIARAVLGALVSAAVPAAWAQLTIYHVPPACYPENGHLVVRASIVSGDPDVAVRLYFRSQDQTSYYFVDMKQQDGIYAGVLPRPLETTRQVDYFIESWDHKYEVVRSKVYRLRVADKDGSCDISPSLVLASESPSIIVRSTSDHAEPQPPGFAPDGIVSYEQGEPLGPPPKGSKKKIAAGVAATAVTAGTVAVLSSSGSAQGEPSPPTGSTNTPPPTAGPSEPTAPSGNSAEPVIACFDAPATALVGQQIRLDASCAQPRSELDYDWDLGDGRERQGRVVSPVYWSAGTYTIALTVKRPSSDALIDRDKMTRQIEIAAAAPSTPAPFPGGGSPGGAADLAIGVSGILTGRIFVWGITYVITVANFGPGPATGVTVLDTLPSTVSLNAVTGAYCTGAGSLSCDLGTLPAGSSKTITMDVTVSPSVALGDVVVNVLTVSAAEPDPRPASNRAEARVQIAYTTEKTIEGGATSDTSLTTSLESFPKVVQGSVLFNQSSVGNVNSSAPARLQWHGTAGRNVIEAFLSAPAEADGVWRFDFTRTEHFQAGSIEVRRGRVLQQDGSHVVFQIGAAAQEKIEFTVRLNP